MIEVRSLEKRFGKHTALRRIDAAIGAGRIAAIAGPNASGKTTLLKIILGLVRPTRGQVLLDGRPMLGDWRVRERIGYMPQHARLPVNLSATEVIRFLVRLRRTHEHRSEELIDAFRLRPEMDKPIRTLSGGTRQKINALISLMFDPEILILDEPTAGLDPLSGRLLKTRIREESARGKTVLLTSHIISDLEELADHIILLIDGQIRFDGGPAEICADTGEPDIEGAFARLMAREVRG